MWKFGILLILILCASFAEAAGVAVVPLFVVIVIEPSRLADNAWVGHWFKDLPDQPSLEMTIWAACILLGLMVLKGLFQAFVYYMQARFVSHQRISLQSRMFKAYQNAPYDWLLQRSSSEMLRNIQNDTVQVIVGVVTPLIDLLMGISMCLFVITVMVMATPSSSLLGILVIGIGLVVTVRLFQKALNNTGVVLREESKAMIQAIQQGFGALVDARMVGCESYLSGIFDQSARKQAKATIARQTMTKSSPLMIETLAILGLLVIFIMLIKGTDQVSEVIPALSLLGIAVVRLKAQAGRIAGAVNIINSSKPFVPGLVKDIQELNQLEQIKIKKKRTVSSSGEEIVHFEKVELKNISYSYPESDKPAISNVSLSFKKGESIAFVGETGCGKSTLVNLILGLLESKSGDIEVNGLSIFHHMDAWRNHLAYIPQTIFLTDDTLRANIAFGIPSHKIDNARVEQALDTACLTDYVANLTDGLETMVGERGVRLSGGQRQRLGIARALYVNPEVLVMDEATSALDNKTESSVMKAIEGIKKGRTTIMIAHRLSTVKRCDRIYFLDAGKIEAAGTYEELLNTTPRFRDMTASEDVR